LEEVHLPNLRISQNFEMNPARPQLSIKEFSFAYQQLNQLTQTKQNQTKLNTH
jgi:hypothetical protein